MLSSSASKTFILTASGAALQTLGLSLMVGGMLALGAFTAPVIFKTFSRPEAASVMATLFSRYDGVILVALVLVLMGEVLRVLSIRNAVGQTGFGDAFRRKRDCLRYGVMALLTASLLYSTLLLNPEIGRMNRAGFHRDETSAIGRQFNGLHHRSETFYKGELLAAVLLILLTPFCARASDNPIRHHQPHSIGKGANAELPQNGNLYD